jgi:putative nucleotidyltransferase with HDIG domain
MDRADALSLVITWTENKNLIKHMLAVEAAMGGLAKHFKEDENLWKVIGLVHDADYEKQPSEHPRVLMEELEKRKEDQKIINAIRAHAWGYNGMNKEPEGKLEWSLFCCDELTGLIVAVALVRPERKLSVVTVENVLSKWNKKDFAKGVERSNIEMCEEKLGIKLNDFIAIVLSSMQSVSSELGL